MPFRADVQGMRAVAVLAVVAAHASIGGLHGGFVGVDVFFVLSGYLITRLILRDVEREGRFSLAEFYARRARRIVPAATLVLGVTLVGSVVYLNFLDAIDATRDIVWAAFFGANIRFATEGVDYFALEDSPSPVQHYWSLAVEEQFYLAWPLLVLLALLLTRRARARAAARVSLDKDAPRTTAPVRTLAVLALLVGAASLAWSVHRTVDEPTSAYFSTFTRAWELAAGVLVALLLHGRTRVGSRWVNEALAVAGLSGIAIAVAAYTTSMAFPGYEALLPVVSTAFLIVSGATPGAEPWLGRLLAIRPLRKIGDWSYSLYLWHWPLIVVPQVNLGRPLRLTETVIAVAMTFQLGYLTHRYVEQPFRAGTFWRGRRWRGLVLYPASLALVLPSTLLGHQVAEYLGGERGHDPAVTTEAYGITGDEVTGLVEASVLAGEAHQAIPSDLTPDLLDLSDDLADVGACNYQLPERELCRRGDVDSDKVMVVTGDSHARAWIPAFEEIAQQAGYATYYLVKQQCTASFVDPGRLGTGDPWPECEDFHGWVTEQVTAMRPDLLVVATSPPPTGVYDDAGNHVTAIDGVHAELAVGFDDMFATYAPLADRVVLLEDVPRVAEEPGSCLAAYGADLGDCMFEPSGYNEAMRQVSIDAAERAGVDHIDPTPWMCFDGLCPIVVGSTIAYRDRSHITATRAGELWSPLGVELGLLKEPKRHRSSERG